MSLRPPAPHEDKALAGLPCRTRLPTVMDLRLELPQWLDTLYEFDLRKARCSAMLVPSYIGRVHLPRTSSLPSSKSPLSHISHHPLAIVL